MTCFRWEEEDVGLGFLLLLRLPLLVRGLELLDDFLLLTLLLGFAEMEEEGFDDGKDVFGGSDRATLEDVLVAWRV
jgi:hypothetical protein